ncbi:zwei Ig domain protein zig-8-like [Aphis craccivora]|uniref:Zwei Ig domain protein zig-8-like n=1 Tax=Aphis craccivora TaxID=307492 RepID=A0A6G0YPF9_APHCR|nr:zwei Ig domain protein zig-8-like [Aphis craccivora]
MIHTTPNVQQSGTLLPTFFLLLIIFKLIFDLVLKYYESIHFSFFFKPRTDIIGGPEIFIDRGSTINLTCVVLHSPEPPSYIFWNHNNAFENILSKCLNRVNLILITQLISDIPYKLLRIWIKFPFSILKNK